MHPPALDLEPGGRTTSMRRPPRLLRNIAYLSGSQVTTWIASLLAAVVVTRAIGPVGNGELSVAIAVYTILVMCLGVGAPTYLVREIARDRQLAPPLLTTAFAVQALALIPVAIGVTVYLLIVPFSPETRLVIVTLALAAIPTVVGATALAATQGIQLMGLTAAVGVLTNLLGTLLQIALVVFGHAQVPVLAAAGLMIQVLGAGICIAGYSRHFPFAWRTNLLAMRTLVRRCIPFLMTTVAYTLYVAADTIILSTFSTTQEVGWYGAANRLFSTLLVVANILSTAWLPRLSFLAPRDPAGLARESRLLTRLSLVGSIPVAIGGALIAGRIVLLLWGAPFAGTIAPLVVLLLTLPATTISIVTFQVLVARHQNGIWAWVMAVALVANVVTNLVVVLAFRAHGWNTATGAACCLAVTEYGMAATAIWLTRHDLGWSTLWSIARAVVAALAMAIVVLLVHSLPLPLVVAAGGAVFCLAALLLRVVTPGDLATVRTILSDRSHS